jgi:RNA polymerase sigma factor (sigma-70 family)
MWMQEREDIALLREYVDHDSEEAFATLVTRHVNKVYSVALRHTRNPHQAEEITQAVFVILAKKSRHLGRGVVLSGWLYQTARLAAVTFIRSEIRRARREQEAQMQTLSNETESDVWTQIGPLLDTAMAGLNEKDRHAVVLRYFDGMSLREVGAALGGSEDAAKMRVNRAVEKLRRFFSKRGVSSTTTIIAGAISANSVQAAPVALAKSVTAVAIAKGAAASGSTITLIKGALKVMAWTKAKTAIVASVVVLAAAGTATVTVKHFTQKRVESPEDVIKRLGPNSGGALSMEAVDFLIKLKKESQLPGYPKDEHGTIQIPIPGLSLDSNRIWHFSDTNVETYPVSRTLHASKNNDGHFVYFYTVIKASETNAWQLQKAWRTDTNGQVVGEFPVP